MSATSKKRRTKEKTYSKGTHAKSTQALQLACRFALPPNSLGYCGRGSAPEKFKACISKGTTAGIKQELTKFIVLHPYFKTIGQLTKKPKFSYEVVESYCLGNELLHKVDNAGLESGYEVLLQNFLAQGVPDWFVAELREKKPKRFIPHHLFQILHVGVGKASGAVPFNLESITNCMVRWGEVSSITNKTAALKLHTLKTGNQGYKLAKITTHVPFNPNLFSDLQPGAVAAVHWGQVIKVLTKKEAENLEFWTREVLNAVQ